MVALQKKGFIRILEAVIAILLLGGIMTYLYVNNSNNSEDFDQYVYETQINILDRIAENETIRNQVLNNEKEKVYVVVGFLLPRNFNYTIAICNLNEVICAPTPLPITKKDIYVEERIISATLDTYSPKVLRLFVWVEQR